MATEKWIAGSGVGLTWTTLFGTEINSLASGNSILSSVVVANGSTTLDMFMDVSFSLGSVTTTGTPFLGLYLYPLNQDASSYGDGRFGSTAADPPPGNYLLGQAGLPVGSQVLTGFFRGLLQGAPLIIPPGSFSAVLYN